MSSDINTSRLRARFGSNVGSPGTTSKVTKKGIKGSQVGTRFLSTRFGVGISGKHKSQRMRKEEGSSKYSPVREGTDPAIWKDGKDVTPLPISIDGSDIPLHTTHLQSRSIGIGTHTPKFNIGFIPPTTGSFGGNDEEKDAASNTATVDENLSYSQKILPPRYDAGDTSKILLTYPDDSEIDTTLSVLEFKKTIQNNPALLDEQITVALSETDTQFIFSMPSKTVSNFETCETEKTNVIATNTQYDGMISKHSDTDLFVEAFTQTYNPPFKEKTILAVPPETKNMSTQATKWAIHDAYHREYDVTQDPDQPTPIHHGSCVDATPEITKAMTDSDPFTRNLQYMERAVLQNVMAEQQILFRVQSDDMDKIQDDLDSDEVADKLQKSSTMMRTRTGRTPAELQVTAATMATELIGDDTASAAEIAPIDANVAAAAAAVAAVNEENVIKPSPLNTDQDDDVSDAMKLGADADLQLLWTYKCDKTGALPCCALDYNPFNTDLIVGGYGPWTFGNSQEGKIAFWTLKNPTNPERIYETESSVCSLNFSRVHPYLLAVGLFDGHVCVYDIRSNSNEPILSSSLGPAKHSTAVWNVLWEKPTAMQLQSKLQQRQKMFSIASDGMVKQWSMKKGFISSNIMSLKRVPNQAALRGSQVDNTISSRQASGLCFDFPANHGNTQYYVGTEDGIVQKCSVSYNEQVLKNYYGHTGPVYKLQCSPFDPDTFITCSMDWTIKIWDQQNPKPVLDLCPGTEAVLDVCWAPFDSCVFASCSEGGRIQVWNLEQNQKDPIITHHLKDEKVNSIMFAADTQALLTALEDGSVNVYRINMESTSHGGNAFTNKHRLYKALQTED